MDVGHPRTELPQGRDRIAAAHQVVPDVEAEGEGVSVDRRGQPLDLGWCFDERPGVGMERDPSSRGSRFGGHGSEERDESVPPSVGQLGRVVVHCVARGHVAVGRTVEGHAEHLAASCDEQTQPLPDLVGGTVGWTVHRRRDRGVDLGEPQLAGREGRAEAFALWEPEAELAAVVADPSDVVQDRIGPRAEAKLRQVDVVPEDRDRADGRA